LPSAKITPRLRHASKSPPLQIAVSLASASSTVIAPPSRVAVGTGAVSGRASASSCYTPASAAHRITATTSERDIAGW
jgi:hypothetical protein